MEDAAAKIRRLEAKAETNAAIEMQIEEQQGIFDTAKYKAEQALLYVVVFYISLLPMPMPMPMPMTMPKSVQQVCQ